MSNLTEDEVRTLARQCLREDVPDWGAENHRILSIDYVDGERLIEAVGRADLPFWRVTFAPPEVAEPDLQPEDKVSVLVFADGTYLAVWDR